MNKEVANTSGVEISNNDEEIYIPPNNNTH